MDDVAHVIDPDLYWAALNALDAEVAILDGHGTILACNDRWSQLSAGRSISAISPTGERDNLVEFWQRSSLTPDQIARLTEVIRGTIKTVEIEYQNPDNPRHWMLLAVSALDRDGGGAIVSQFDISQRKNAVIALQTSESRFQGLVVHGMEAISIADLNGIILYEAPGIERVLGFRPEELVGKTMPGVHPEDGARAGAEMLSLYQTPGGHHTFNMRIRNKAGEYRHLEITATNMLDNPAISGMVYNFRDITDRRIAEQEFRTQSDLLNQAWVSVIALDTDYRITHWNQYSEKLYGWTAEEAEHRSFVDLLIQKEDRDQLAHAFARQDPQEGWQGEFACRQKDGSLVDVRVNTSTLLDDQSQYIGHIVISVDISDRKRVENQLRYLAVHDALTGLPNRTLLFDRIEQALVQAERRHTEIAVLFIDLDRFKFVNDSFGHAAGDTVLKSVASRFLDILPRDVTLARLSGDEFVVILSDIQGPDVPMATAKALQDALLQPFDIQGQHQALIGASIGVTYSNQGKLDAETLIRQADAALYEVKSTSRGAIRSYDPRTNLDATRYLELKRDIRTALVRNEFSLAFQQIVDLKAGESPCVEALLRWNHPTFGTVMPNEFIAIAEDLGLLVPIGRWVLAEVGRHLDQWDASTNHSPRVVAINLSPQQFADPNLVNDIGQAVATGTIDPHRLILELTEDALIQDMSAAIATLTRLREMGLQVMIDDFGSGYSSLGYLRQLPVDGIKLDKSFVRGLGTEAGSLAIVDAIIQMVHVLGLKIVAEGIETVEQLEYLQEMGCEFGQGYLFGYPASVTESWRFTAPAPGVTSCPWTGAEP